MKAKIFMIAALLGCGLSSPVAAEVKALSAQGFQVQHVLRLNAPPAKVWTSLLDIGRWWSSEHTYSGESGNLSIDPRAGGCFCEALPNGGGVEHMRVAWIAPGQTLRMIGGLGPLQGDGVGGSMTWTLAPREAGSELRLDYVVGGYSVRGFDRYAPLVDGMLAEQLLRFKAWVETGKPQ